jgi:hypothetical protein
MVLKTTNIQRLVLMKINEKGNKLLTNVAYQITDQIWPTNYESAYNYVTELYHEATPNIHISFEKKIFSC